MTTASIEDRVAKLEAFVGVDTPLSAESSTAGSGPGPTISESERLLRIVVAEIKEDLTALAETYRRRDADHSRHIWGVDVKYGILSGYLNSNDDGLEKALKMWPSPQRAAKSLAEQVRCRICRSDE